MLERRRKRSQLGVVIRRKNALATRPYPFPIRHMEPEIKLQKYVYTRILSGFYKAVVDLKIVKVKVHLLPGFTRFLSGIWNQKLTYKNMFIPGSYPVSIRQLSTCKLLR